MKRILFVYHVSAIGGGSYCLLNILKVIDRNYFEPVVMLPSEGPLCNEIRELGIEIVFFPPLILYPYNRSLFIPETIKSITKISRCLKSFSGVISVVKPDIVYFNSMMLFPYLKTAKNQGCKTVLHIREHWPLNEHKWQLEIARKLVNKYADRLIAINRYSASIFPQKDSTVVYDWVDMESRLGGPSLNELMGEDCSNKKVYLFTGGLQPIKGTLTVLKAFSEIIKGDDRRLLALGIGPILTGRGIKEYIKKLLVFIGYKTYSEKVFESCRIDGRIKCVPAIYNITNLMKDISGSISFFTIPHANLALAESIILHIPAVAASTDESMEYSNEGELAYLYPIGDVEEFKKTWERLDSGFSPLNDNNIKDVSFVVEMFSPNNNSEKLNNTLKGLA